VSRIIAREDTLWTVEDASLVALLLDALRRLEVDVRTEPLPESPIGAGAICVLHGRPTLLLDVRAPVHEQVDVLVRALRTLDTSALFLHPAVRSRL
jgi:hypothetical protein